MARTDTRTTTPADAHWFEMERGGGYGPSESNPSAHELGQDAYLDRENRRMRDKRRAAAIARGEYVASPVMERAVSSAAWPLMQRGCYARVSAYREDVIVIGEVLDIALLDEVFPAPKFEHRQGDSVTWVRVLWHPITNLMGSVPGEAPF